MGEIYRGRKGKGKQNQLFYDIKATGKNIECGSKGTKFLGKKNI